MLLMLLMLMMLMIAAAAAADDQTGGAELGLWQERHHLLHQNASGQPAASEFLLLHTGHVGGLYHYRERGSVETLSQK